jgi:hypothetical protein
VFVFLVTKWLSFIIKYCLKNLEGQLKTRLFLVIFSPFGEWDHGETVRGIYGEINEKNEPVKVS